MPTTQHVVSVVVNGDLEHRLRTEAARQQKSLSRVVRELLEERLRPTPRRRGGASALMKLSGLAHGEFVGIDLDREVYER